MPKVQKAEIRKCARCRKDKAGVSSIVVICQSGHAFSSDSDIVCQAHSCILIETRRVDEEKQCEPHQRVLPRRCDRCVRYDYICSENLTARQEKQRPGQGIDREPFVIPNRLQSDAACLQEMGDITSLLEVLKITKSRQKIHKWSYSETDAKNLLNRLQDAVRESIKRAQQHESDGCWREAEYLWRSISNYGTANRLEQSKEIRIARMEAKFHETRYKNRIIGLSQLVALHERLGDFPAAEREQEILVARSARSDVENGQSPLDCDIQTLIRLYGKFQDRVAALEVIGLERDAMKEIANLSLLFRAIGLECMELWVALLKSNNAIFVMPGEGLTLLHLSASSGSMTLITLLLSIGADVNLPNYSKRSALHLAAREGHTTVIKALLEERAKINWQDEDGYSPLHFACTEGYVAAAKALLDNGADVKIRTTCNGLSPLHLAVQEGREEIVRLLLEHGSKVEERTARGETIVHLATKNGHETLLKTLLEINAEKDSADVYGIRPIHDAANVGIAQLLLDQGADAHGPDKFGETPLLSAAWRTDLNVVELLLKYNVNVNVQDDQGRTPLHRAVLKKRRRIVSCLLENGAEVNARDHKFASPLHEATRSGEVEIVRLLLEHGVEPQFSDDLRNSVLQYATLLRTQATSERLRERLDVICSILKGVPEKFKLTIPQLANWDPDDCYSIAYSSDMIQ